MQKQISFLETALNKKNWKATNKIEIRKEKSIFSAPGCIFFPPSNMKVSIDIPIQPPKNPREFLTFPRWRPGYKFEWWVLAGKKISEYVQ